MKASFSIAFNALTQPNQNRAQFLADAGDATKRQREERGHGEQLQTALSRRLPTTGASKPNAMHCRRRR
ncbi:MAG: hypothetical protein ACRYG5_14040 [Janthinobacterium lividum]